MSELLLIFAEESSNTFKESKRMFNRPIVSPGAAPIYFDLEYNVAFPQTNYYVKAFGKIPNNYTLLGEIQPSYVEEIIKEGFELLWSSRKVCKGEDLPSQEVYKKEEALIAVVYVYKQTDQNFEAPVDDFNPYNPEDEEKGNVLRNITLDFFYGEFATIKNLISKLSSYAHKEKKGGNICLIYQQQGGLLARPYPIKVPEFDIELHYGKKFVPVYNKIVKRLNEDRGKGLVLLHGIPGSGKTTLVRHLATKVKKDVLFLPPFMAMQVADPGFLPFLMSHNNSIIVIEDAEKVILDRESGASVDQGVSNILNLTDGILSDCLGIQVIATFNTEREKIDTALLRKGRLIAEWKFGKLSMEDSQALFDHLGKDTTAEGEMILTDIYNIDDEVHVVQEERPKIGFTKKYK